MINKDKSIIPPGIYCYTYIEGEEVKCPYHRIIKGRPYQYNGWCDYLGEGDLEINRKSQWKDNEGNVGSAEEIGLPMSLLWDGCKECGEKEEDYTVDDRERELENGRNNPMEDDIYSEEDC